MANDSRCFGFHANINRPGAKWFQQDGASSHVARRTIIELFDIPYFLYIRLHH